PSLWLGFHWQGLYPARVDPPAFGLAYWPHAKGVGPSGFVHNHRSVLIQQRALAHEYALRQERVRRLSVFGHKELEKVLGIGLGSTARSVHAGDAALASHKSLA